MCTAQIFTEEESETTRLGSIYNGKNSFQVRQRHMRCRPLTLHENLESVTMTLNSRGCSGERKATRARVSDRRVPRPSRNFGRRSTEETASDGRTDDKVALLTFNSCRYWGPRLLGISSQIFERPAESSIALHRVPSFTFNRRRRSVKCALNVHMPPMSSALPRY